jgi:hypothetical protein
MKKGMIWASSATFALLISTLGVVGIWMPEIREWQRERTERERDEKQKAFEAAFDKKWRDAFARIPKLGIRCDPVFCTNNGTWQSPSGNGPVVIRNQPHPCDAVVLGTCPSAIATKEQVAQVEDFKRKFCLDADRQKVDPSIVFGLIVDFQKENAFFRGEAICSGSWQFY